ncbi:unnamed protein product [Rhodiola kirilowii]
MPKESQHSQPHLSRPNSTTGPHIASNKDRTGQASTSRDRTAISRSRTSTARANP